MTDEEQNELSGISDKLLNLEDILGREENRKRARSQQWRTFAKWALVTVVSAGLPGGGYGVYRYKTAPEPVPAVGPAQVEATVVREGKALDDRMTEAERRLNVLGRDNVRQDVTMVEGIRFLGLKIDKAHPRTANDTAKPQSVDLAEQRVIRILEDAAVDALFAGEVDPEDPLKEEERAP